MPTCISYNEVTVTVQENPEVFAGNDTIICESTTAQLGELSNNTDIAYIWTPNMVNAVNISNPTTRILTSSTKFFVTATSTTAPFCKSTDSVFVEVKKAPTILVTCGEGSYLEGGGWTYIFVRFFSYAVYC